MPGQAGSGTPGHVLEREASAGRTVAARAAAESSTAPTANRNRERLRNTRGRARLVSVKLQRVTSRRSLLGEIFLTDKFSRRIAFQKCYSKIEAVISEVST